MVAGVATISIISARPPRHSQQVQSVGEPVKMLSTTVYVPPNAPDTSDATAAERLDDLLQRVFDGCETIRQQALKVGPERPLLAQ